MKISKKSGFTLIELMVVMAIIGIMASIAVVNFGRNPDRDVRLEKDRLVTFLRNIQGKSLTAEKVSGASGKVCGFGVNFKDSSTLQAYYVDTTLDGICSSVSKTLPDSSHVIAGEVFYSTSSVTIGNFSDIFFLSPQGVIYSNGSLLSSDVQINLTKTGLSSPIPVTITPGGVIK